MPDCFVCGRQPNIQKRCNHCSEPVCEEHALPENHDCVGLKVNSGGGKHFENDFPDDNSGISKPKPRRNKHADWEPESKSTGDLDERAKRINEESNHPRTQDGGAFLGSQDGSPPVKTKKERRRPRMAQASDPSNSQYTRLEKSRITARIWQGRIWKWAPRVAAVVVLAILLINVGVFAPSAVPGGDTVDFSASDVPNIETGPLLNSTEKSSGERPTGAYNRKSIENAIHQEVNEVRSNHSHNQLRQRDGLRQVARGHSKDMAENGYFDHTSPIGETMDDRYREGGIDCRMMGENIAQSWYGVSTIGPGDGLYTTPEEFAAAVVQQWMNSQGHRENILRPQFNSEGIGVYAIKAEGGYKVYVTQNFCG